MAVILGSPGIYLGGASVPPVPPFVNEYSMSFDGIGDYIYAGTSSLGITGSISVSAWVKIPTTNTGGGALTFKLLLVKIRQVVDKEIGICFGEALDIIILLGLFTIQICQVHQLQVLV